jgi:beta-glucosidase
MRKTVIFLVLLIAAAGCSEKTRTPVYKDASLPIEKRVRDLLSRMTVEEKVQQLRTMHAGNPPLKKEILDNPQKMDSLFRNGIGMINPEFSLSNDEILYLRRTLQDYLINKTRLGIPVIFIDEGHHGLMVQGANVFPQAIGLSASWDMDLIQEVYSNIAREAYSRGTRLFLTPVVDLAREPRWGRIGETTGEDPYLTSRIGTAMVRGFQGSSDGTIANGHVAATLKHFAAYGQTEGGNNQAPADLPERYLRSNHLETFRSVIENAKPACIMPSYNEIDGLPSHANKWLLTDVLRNEWRFEGVVVSDWWGIDHLWKKHFVAADQKDACLRAFKAGVTCDLPYGENYTHLTELVSEKKISIAELDAAVSKVLGLKFMLGLFDDFTIDPDKINAVSKDPTIRALSRTAAERSIVLLKNDKNTLPIKAGQYRKIAVIGPCAAVNYLGDYSGIPFRNVSLLEGIRNKAGKNTEILYAPGCRITSNGDTISMINYQFIDKVTFPSAEENLELIREAVAVAKQADFIVAAVGENEQLSREAWDPDHFGDNVTLELLSQQNELVQALAALKKPMVVYLMHARPLSINWIAENVPAIIDGTFMGQEAGNAFANILFGEISPSGKLTVTWPKSVGQIPMFYNHKPGAQHFEYVSSDNKPLFPFGYGLSYTHFNYAGLRLSSQTMKSKESITAEVDITNTGNIKADEIVQLYIRDKVSSVTRPVLELKDFSRITLEPGETRTVSFIIDDSKLKFWNVNMEFAAEPGEFEVLVGRSSVDYLKADFTLTEERQ